MHLCSDAKPEQTHGTLMQVWPGLLCVSGRMPGTRGAEDPTEIPCAQNPAHNESLCSLSKRMALTPNQTIQPITSPSDVRARMKAQPGQQHSGTDKRHLLGLLMSRLHPRATYSKPSKISHGKTKYHPGQRTMCGRKTTRETR